MHVKHRMTPAKWPNFMDKGRVAELHRVLAAGAKNQQLKIPNEWSEQPLSFLFQSGHIEAQPYLMLLIAGVSALHVA